MKLIIAIVRPFTIEKLVSEFEAIEGFPGMTVVDSEGFGQRLLKDPVDALDPFKPNKRIEIAAAEEMVEPIVNAIKRGAHTGRKGDGIILIVPVEASVLI